MGEHTAPLFPQEVIDEYAALGIDLPALFSAGHLGERMGVTIVEAAADRVVGTMPVEGNTQPYGLLHGGASAVLAETLGSIGSMLHGGAGKIAVGVEPELHPPPRRPQRPRHRRRHPRTPRPLDRHVRDRHHRRTGQAGLYRPSHLPPP
ncbi:Thioesterase OS=Streptomyces microflavus OX=1919 GN=HUT09_07420 PE=3 SV=1 [Streptomyces microflavus]